MFKWLEKLVHEKAIYKWLSQAYHPLFDVRDKLQNGMVILTGTLGFLEDMQKELRSTEDKNEAHIIKDRWQAIKLDGILEHYRLAIQKLQEAIDNIPQRPTDPPTMEIEYYHDFKDQ